MMATESVVVARVKCPVCGSLVSEPELGRAGLRKEELNILRRHIKEATFGKLLQLVDIAMKRLDPDRMSQELLSKEAIVEITRTLNGLNERILGPAIGKIGEIVTIKEFKSLATMDNFSEEKASKQGTDIVAMVTEHGTPEGKIAISVKYDTSWRTEFLRQLARNMRQEETKFGILVTKVFPNEALNDKAYVREDRTGNVMLVAKPEYAAVAYYGFRQAVIAWNEAQKIVRDAESKVKTHQRLVHAVMKWINGQKFAGTMNKIKTALDLSNQTDDLTENVRNYVNQKVAAIKSIQQELRTNLIEAEALAQELKELLRLSDGDGNKHHLPSPSRTRGE